MSPGLPPRTLDLNLLRVFDAVMERRSVSGASRQLGVTASAISHALSRLRRALNDELFVFGEEGMTPTPRALSLHPGLLDGLLQIGRTLQLDAFEPGESSREFRLAATDYASCVVVPALVARLAGAAPKLGLHVVAGEPRSDCQRLDSGEIALAIGWSGSLPGRMRQAAVVLDDETLVVRSGHPLAGQQVTLDQLARYQRVVVDGNAREAARHAAWFPAPARVSVPCFAAVPGLLEASDLVAIMPTRLAFRVAGHGRLALVRLPDGPSGYRVDAVWHQRSERDPGLRWVVAQLLALFRDEVPAESTRAAG